MSIDLDRRKITGPIDQNFPFPVVLRIAACHGIKYSDRLFYDDKYLQVIIDEIKKLETTTLDHSFDELDTTQLSNVARFVNPEIPCWKKKPLREALSLLTNPAKLDKVISAGRLSFGHPDNRHPLRLDETLVFKLIRRFKLPHHRANTFVEMISTLSIYLMPVKYLLNMVVKPRAKAIKEWFDRKEYPQPAIDQVVKDQILLAPRNNSEAIYAGIIKYQIDLSLLPDPLTSYYLLPRIKVPDQRVKRRTNHGTYFNAGLPISLYRRDQLEKFCRQEGIDLGSPTNMYQRLQERYLLNNFHSGWQPEVSGDESFYQWEDLTEQAPEKIISWGVLSHNYRELEGNEMKALLLSELSAMFRVNYSFNNDLDKSVFSKEAIYKLKNICRGLINTYRTCHDAQELLNLIIAIEMKEATSNQQVKQWHRKVVSMKKTKEVITSLKLLFEAGMYMRSWDGHSEYPVRSKVPDRSELVDRRVNDSVSRLIELVKKLPRVITILDLPLYLQKNGSLQRSTKKTEGLTIGGRLKIIMKGDSSETIDSCIRISSNWIVSTAEYYLRIMGHPSGINLSNLEYIS